MNMERGKVIYNDGVKVKTQVGNRVLEYWAREHDPSLFPVGEEVSVIGTTVYKDATTGHTFLVSDWVAEVEA